MTPKKFEKEIILLANKGFRPVQIAKTLNLNSISVNSYLKSKGFNFSTKYSINSNYFEKIDTPIKSYLLGFIAADGYIVKSKNTIFGIQLNIIDIEVLNLLKKELNTEKPIMITKDNKMCRFTVGDKKIVSDLINLGITPKKSLTLTNMLNNISYEFRDSFIFGYFDGDGCMFSRKPYISRTNKPSKGYSSSLTISFRGTKELLIGIINHLKYDNYSLFFNKTWVLTINHSKYTYSFITKYKNHCFVLSRKLNKIKHIFNYEEYKKLQV